jgi:hypothetical protein
MGIFIGLLAFLFFAISLVLIILIFWIWGHTREELNSKLELGYHITFKAIRFFLVISLISLGLCIYYFMK